MKLLTSVVFGAAALAFASFASATPAKADSFGVYLGAPGYHHYYDRYHRCDSWRYRRRHPYRCRYWDDDYYDYYYDDYYYRPGFGIFFGSDRHRYWRHGRHHWRHGHHRHRHGHHRRHRRH
jgi:hypothetical protein